MAQTVRQLRHTYRGEEKWFPLLEEAGEWRLGLGFIACGAKPREAWDIVELLDEQRRLDRKMSEATRVRRRRELRKFDLELVTRAIPR